MKYFLEIIDLFILIIGQNCKLLFQNPQISMLNNLKTKKARNIKFCKQTRNSVINIHEYLFNNYL